MARLLAANAFHPGALVLLSLALGTPEPVRTAQQPPRRPMPPPTSSTADLDARLIARISQGDQPAFQELYDRFSRPLYSMAFKILQNPEDSEDVLQLAFLQVWKKAAGFEASRASVFTWLVVITRSKAIDRLRQRQRQQRLTEEQALEHPPEEPGERPFSPAPFQESAADDLQQGERREAIRLALGKIPADQRDAIELAFFKGLTQTQISETLATPLGTIKARIRRGMLRLRDTLESRLQ